MMTSSNTCCHFEFFFYKTKDIMLVIMHAKFEVNSCCGWDFRQGSPPPCLKAINPPPPINPHLMHKRYLRHNRVKENNILIFYGRIPLTLLLRAFFPFRTTGDSAPPPPPHLFSLFRS